MAGGPFHLTDQGRYGFDLQGYVVVPGALGATEVDACNRAIDAVAGTPAAADGMLGWPEPHREPFRRLLVHPAVVARLNELCGTRFRLDHGPRLLAGGDGTGAELQGGGEPFSPAAWYHQQNGRIFASAVTAAWQLAGEGGLCVVPGSHKAVEPAPEGVRAGGDRDAPMDVVRELPTRVGDLVLFAETITHGVRPGNGAGDRRIVQYTYTARAVVAHAGRALPAGGGLGRLDAGADAPSSAPCCTDRAWMRPADGRSWSRTALWRGCAAPPARHKAGRRDRPGTLPLGPVGLPDSARCARPGGDRRGQRRDRPLRRTPSSTGRTTGSPRTRTACAAPAGRPCTGCSGSIPRTASRSAACWPTRRW